MNVRWLGIPVAGLFVLVASCGAEAQDAAHLRARPAPPTATAEAGLHSLGIAPERDAMLYVPKSYDPSHPARLMVLLHGATQSSELWTRFHSFLDLADQDTLVLLIPNSQGQTWDFVRSGYGVDVRAIDSALVLVFRQCNIDPRHIALAGFSDGASYALSLGASNGDLVRAAIAFSPGFFAPGELAGKPVMFIGHGTSDRILPIDAASRRMVPLLRRSGYEVTYREFDGGHTMQPEEVKEAFAWFVALP
jgi:predicted esterase